MPAANKRLWIEVLLHFLFWAGVFFVLTSLNSSHIHRFFRTPGFGVASDHTGEKEISTYIYIILFLLAALFYGNIFWVFPKVIRYKKGIIRLAFCAGWFTLVFAANYFIDGPLFDQANPAPEPRHIPFLLDSLKKNNAQVQGPRQFHAPFRPPGVDAISFLVTDWRQIQPVILLAFLVIEGIAIAYFFLREWAKSELIQTRLQANQLSTEIKFLKSQINPHFMFNTLNNLFSMAQAKGNDELADGISKLSGMMRYMLYDSNEESVLLSKEITYLQECITLNKLRYADSEVIVTFEYAGEITNVRIAPMLFIPFVENAFKHGVAIGERAEIQIAINASAKKLNFSCVNTDYSGIKKMEMKISGIGLENVSRRLELVYPGKHRLTISKEDLKFKVNLEIDFS